MRTTSAFALSLGFVLVGATTVVAVARSGVSASASEPSTVRPAAHSAAPADAVAPGWTCAGGPARVSDMEIADGGFLRARGGGTPARHEFYFTRAMYSDGRGRGGFGYSRRWGDMLGDGGPTWSIDYPSADHHMMLVATRLSNLDACELENPVSLADPDLRRYPFLYSLEWGSAALTEAEVDGLRSYLHAGGFLMLDDFWGSAEWANFERQIGRVLPDYPIVEIPRDHLLFRIHYTIEGEILQIPNVGNGRAVARGYAGARTWEQDGRVPHVRGIFDDDGRLLVAIFWNTDLGDALEWAEDAEYPLNYSTFASQLFLNTIVYAMGR